ncbi:MAG TPA: DUF4388 domain-containing protein [Candidatus Paceibacterota bacterium]|nr:DUF4388 domain-containing protein [Candidatus Paceibacterota bacterium]
MTTSEAVQKPNRLRNTSVRFRHGTAAALVALAMALPEMAFATISGPYQPDSDTLHLWHMNEQAVPVIDISSDGLHLNALRNGATLGNAAFPGFGTALSTFDGGPDATSDVSRDAYLSARPLVDGTGDNVKVAYAGHSGAFTFEALVRIDFDPQLVYIDTTVSNRFMQIVNLDADEPTNRVCQFRVVPRGVLKGNTEPLLEFINLNKDKQPQSLTAKIPTAGPNAISVNGWFHAAVTYDGAPNRPENVKFYWTSLRPEHVAANLIGTGQMQNSLPTDCSPDFAIGQTGRQSPVTPYPNNNFVGLIDEVRISGVARAASQMIFGGSPALVAKNAAKPATGSSPGTLPISPATGGPREAGGEKFGGVFWLIAGALLVIVVLLGWLAFALRKFLTKGSGDSESSAVAAPTANRDEAAASSSAVHSKITIQTTETATEIPAAHVGEAGAGEAALHSGEPHSEDGFRGMLRKVGIQDLIQLECLNRKSSILDIADKNLRGRIYIEHGEIIHAVVGDITGEDAFNKLLSLPGGEFMIKAFETPDGRTIRGQWIQLLMEAARRRDEGGNSHAEKPVSFKPSSSTNTEDVLTMASLLADHPQVREILVRSSEGKTLFNAKCEQLAEREKVCSHLLETTKAISELLPLGSFEHLEILRPDFKTVIQTEQDCHLLIGLEHGMSTLPL